MKSSCKATATMLPMLAVLCGPALAAPPEISNLVVGQVPHSLRVEITFDLFDADGDLAEVAVMLSTDGGESWPFRCRDLTGDFYQVASGTGKQISWDAGAEYPDFQGDQCRIRLFATDVNPLPRFEMYKVAGADTTRLSLLDTVPYGLPLTLYWQGRAPLADSLDLDILAQMDTVYPFTDGLLGFKFQTGLDDCLPALEDCWQPRRYDEATGDSVSYFGAVTTLTFNEPGHAQLPDGVTTLKVNTIDLVQNEIPAPGQEFPLVHNCDPLTMVLDGETDWIHPEDPEVYPYYIQLNDPAQVHHPFQSGDNIPDRTYVVFKALYRDDPRDLLMNPEAAPGLTGHFLGTTSLLYGGLYSFQSGASLVDYEPAWPADQMGWYADTLGFLTAPRTEFTMNLQAVDEHGRRDGTPAALTFTVGNPPCVQCLELLPGSSVASAFSADLECYDGTPGEHPCFSGEPVRYFVKPAGAAALPGRQYLPQLGVKYLAIDRVTLYAEFTDTAPAPDQYYSFVCNVYDLAAVLHGRDDLQEAWSTPLLRTLAWRYQLDYACDPSNSIRDGGGFDDLDRVTWGEDSELDLLHIDPATGLWRMQVEVMVPQQLLTMGADTFRQIIYFSMAGGDERLTNELFAICLRQLGSGTLTALALDQTQCGAQPLRPARYHVFDGVRPSVADPGPATWRTCNPTFPGVDFSLGLDRMAQESAVQAVQPFNLVLQQIDGTDLTCDEVMVKALPVQRPWYERER